MADELRRRAIHASGSGFPLIYVADLVTWPQLRRILIAALVSVTILEFLRLVVGLDHSIYDRLTREYEQDNVAGYALFVMSVTLVAFVFPPPVAIAGMLMLSIGDPIAGLLGDAEATSAKKAGVLAVMFLVCFILAAPFTLQVPGTTPSVAFAAAGAGALGATVADGLKPVIRGYVIDDNLTIPPLGCLGIVAVFTAAGVSV